MPVQGSASPAVAGDRVTMHCKKRPPKLSRAELTRRHADKFDDASGNYTQTVSVNNETVSTLSTSSGEALGWGSAVECAENNCGTVPAHCESSPMFILYR